MGRLEDCTFCDPVKLGADRIINDEDPDFYSFTSNPWFPGRDHSLVVAREHTNTLFEIDPNVLGKMLAEAALLGTAIDEGYGTIITQKNQPKRAEGNIKQNHPHIHVWRRLASDSEEVPFPVPSSLRENDPNGFAWPTIEEIIATRDRVKALSDPLRVRGGKVLYSCATQKMRAYGEFSA